MTAIGGPLVNEHMQNDHVVDASWKPQLIAKTGYA